MDKSGNPNSVIDSHQNSGESTENIQTQQEQTIDWEKRCSTRIFLIFQDEYVWTHQIGLKYSDVKSLDLELQVWLEIVSFPSSK